MRGPRRTRLGKGVSIAKRTLVTNLRQSPFYLVYFVSFPFMKPSSPNKTRQLKTTHTLQSPAHPIPTSQYTMEKHLETHTLKTARGLNYRYYATPPSVTSKHTLLLCHGFPDGAELWQFVLPKLLETGLRIIAPDLIGYGGTDKPEDPAAYEWRAQSADLNQILKKEGVEGHVVSVGHDW